MFADYDMRIGTTEAKRADRSLASLFAGRLPSPQSAVDVKRTVLQGDMLVELLEVDRRRKLLVLKRQEDLDEPGNSSRRQAMADIALDGAQGAVLSICGVLSEGIL